MWAQAGGSFARNLSPLLEIDALSYLSGPAGLPLFVMVTDHDRGLVFQSPSRRCAKGPAPPSEISLFDGGLSYPLEHCKPPSVR
jgi:hypothetical protein